MAYNVFLLDIPELVNKYRLKEQDSEQFHQSQPYVSH